MPSNNVSTGLASQLMGISEEQAIRTLEMEGRRLKYIVLKVWRGYLDSYSPKEYVRTRNTQRGIKLGRVKRIDGNHFGIELTFENDLMYHDSVMSGGGPKGHSFMLISEGWRVKNGKHKNVYMFGYFEGANLIEKIVKEYNAGAPRGVSLDVNWSGKTLK